MKTTTFKITLIACLFLSTLNISAQKIGHINLDSLIGLMPESKEAEKASMAFIKELETSIGTMQGELQTKYQDYMANQDKYSDLVKQTKEKELQDLNQRIQEFQASAQEEVNRKKTELAKPIYDKAKKAIDQIAKDKGYKYVLDTSLGNVLFSDPADDLLSSVSDKLGLSKAAKAATPATQGTMPKPKEEPKK
ncbi:MAG: OmpH family outer membrane protein [Bacteroidetes bacterium]|nr:OmpH family outer membrane protein [Bacteroidota bacterium]